VLVGGYNPGPAGRLVAWRAAASRGALPIGFKAEPVIGNDGEEVVDARGKVVTTGERVIDPEHEPTVARMFALTGQGATPGVISSTLTPPARPTPAPPPSPVRINSPVSTSWLVKKRYLLLRRIVVKELPTGATVTITCRGKGCPLKGAPSRPARTGR